MWSLTPAKTPEIAKKIWPSYLWNIPTDKPEIFLTFDDGPTPEITEWVLQTLADFEAKASFFCIGDNVRRHPEILKKISDSKHTIGNHTQNHLQGWKTNFDTYLDNVAQADTTLKTQGIHTRLFRPPYGKITNRQAKALQEKGFKIVMWDVLSIDWDMNLAPEKCLNNVTEHVCTGSIIVFHDSLKAERNLRYALPRVLEWFSVRGFLFGGIQ